MGKLIDFSEDLINDIFRLYFEEIVANIFNI